MKILCHSQKQCWKTLLNFLEKISSVFDSASFPWMTGESDVRSPQRWALWKCHLLSHSKSVLKNCALFVIQLSLLRSPSLWIPTIMSNEYSYSREIEYSSRYADEHYEYRHVRLPRGLSNQIPNGPLMSEEEWRAIGIMYVPFRSIYFDHIVFSLILNELLFFHINKCNIDLKWNRQSRGWEHFLRHSPEPHILLFRRAKEAHNATGKCKLNWKPSKEATVPSKKALDVLQQIKRSNFWWGMTERDFINALYREIRTESRTA